MCEMPGNNLFFSPDSCSHGKFLANIRQQNIAQSRGSISSNTPDTAYMKYLKVNVLVDSRQVEEIGEQVALTVGRGKSE